jgi:hypothetical protein
LNYDKFYSIKGWKRSHTVGWAANRIVQRFLKLYEVSPEKELMVSGARKQILNNVPPHKRYKKMEIQEITHEMALNYQHISQRRFHRYLLIYCLQGKLPVEVICIILDKMMPPQRVRRKN